MLGTFFFFNFDYCSEYRNAWFETKSMESYVFLMPLIEVELLLKKVYLKQRPQYSESYGQRKKSNFQKLMEFQLTETSLPFMFEKIYIEAVFVV